MVHRPLLSLVPFPPLSWWALALAGPAPLLDAGEPFRKMGHRNRYRIATASGPHWLTVPILGGREQHTPLHAIRTDPRTPWQRTHWRTLCSAYRRAPFFEHYERSLQPLYECPWADLAGFAEASLLWIRDALRLPFEVAFYAGDEPVLDGRDGRQPPLPAAPPYLQVFAERTGFLPDLSVLDLLFCEGPAAAAYLYGLAGTKKAST